MGEIPQAPETAPESAPPAPMPDPPPRVWTIGLALLAMFTGVATIGLVVALVVFGTATGGAEAGEPLVGTLPGLLVLAGATTTWVTLVALIAARLSPEAALVRLGLVEVRGLDPIAWGAALLGGLALSQAVDLALRLSGAGRGIALDHMLGVLAGARGPWLAVSVLVVGVGAGLAEELFFRGYVQRRLVARYGGTAGVIAAAALFALAHLDPQHSVFAFLFGLYVGALALWTGSTWPAIVIHAANNAAAVLLVASGADEAGQAATSTNRLLIVFVVYAAVAVVALAFVRRRLNLKGSVRPAA
jgi:membrane protease YdiL (CAAX protease family)